MEVCRRHLQLPCHWCALIAWIALLLPGCRTRPGAELMERDLRLQEDHIYQLQDFLADQQASLESCRRENAALRSELSADSPSRRAAPLKPLDETPKRPGSAPSTPFAAPEVEMGQPVGPDEIPAEPAGPPGEPEPLPGPEPAAELGAAGPLRLTINRRLTGGLDTNGRPGDEGLMVVLEPQDRAGEPVRLQGAVALAVYEEGGQDRVARWDFTADEAAAMWRKSLFGHGYHFELAWPAGPPSRQALELEAELWAGGGMTLQANHSFSVELPADQHSGHRPAGGERIPWRPDR